MRISTSLVENTENASKISCYVLGTGPCPLSKIQFSDLLLYSKYSVRKQLTPIKVCSDAISTSSSENTETPEDQLVMAAKQTRSLSKIKRIIILPVCLQSVPSRNNNTASLLRADQPRARRNRRTPERSEAMCLAQLAHQW